MSRSDLPQNPSQALARVLVDELARCGVTDAVLAPGSRSAALAMVLHDDARIRLHVQVDERSAAFCALGLARASGRPAAVVTTSGSAVANLHPAVVEADTARVPLLLLTADRPPELRHTGANQTIEQPGIFGRAPRWQVDLGVAEDRPTSNALWRATVCRAVAEASGATGEPGPVHVNLAFREPTVPAGDDGRGSVASPFQATTQGRADGQPWVDVTRGIRLPSGDTIRDLAQQIASTARGLIVVGATDAEPAPMLALARAAGWPMLAEAVSGARRGPDAVAHGALLTGHEGFAAAHTPDLVVRIGRLGLSREVEAFLGPDIPQVLIDPDGRFDDPARVVSRIIAADVAPTCDALCAALDTLRARGVVAARSSGADAAEGDDDVGDRTDWSAAWHAADGRVSEALNAVLDAVVEPNEPRIARDLAAVLPDPATLVVASSMPVRDLDRFLAPCDGLRVIANRGASGIDGFVSTAIGVALAAGSSGRAPAGPTVGLVGDLALLHDANGFLLDADATSVDLTLVVVDNDGGGIFSFLPQAGFPTSFERVFGTPHGRDLADLARLHGMGYTTVDTAQGLPGAVDEAIATGGIGLVHVRTNRAANVALHARLTEAAHAALETMRRP